MIIERQLSRVCFVTPNYPPAIGGISRSAKRIVRFLAESFDVHVFVFSKCADLGKELIASTNEDGIHVHRVKVLPESSTMIMTFAMRYAIQEIDRRTPFDIFHGFFLPLAHLCMGIAENQRPVIASMRGSDSVIWMADPWYQNIIKSVLEKAAWVTAVSTEQLSRISELTPISDRASVIMNSIDSAAFPKWRLTDDNRGVVGTVGEFRKMKNIPLLIESYAHLDRGLRRKLILVGDFTEAEPRLKSDELIRQNGLSSEVCVTGILNDMSDILRRLLSIRVFVQCSIHEGSPNALLEAAAVGVPLVATNVGGMRDILKDGDNALVVPSDDRKRLAGAIKSVLRDDALADSLSQGALKLAETLQPAQEKKAWLDLYDRLLASSGNLESKSPLERIKADAL
jgi:glycosyltransferase involved in cell wall biosynthesis